MRRYCFSSREGKDKMLLKLNREKAFGLIDAIIASLIAAVAVTAIMKSSWTSLHHFNMQQSLLREDSARRTKLVLNMPSGCSSGEKNFICQLEEDGKTIEQGHILQ